MKALLSLLLLNPFALAATPSSEFDLICIPPGFPQRKLIAIQGSEGGEIRALEVRTAEGVKKICTDRYAILTPITGKDAPSEIREGAEFELKVTKYFKGKPSRFAFLDLKTDETYACEPNREVHSQPAVSRSGRTLPPPPPPAQD